MAEAPPWRASRPAGSSSRPSSWTRSALTLGRRGGEDSIEDGEAQPCTGGARAAQGFSRSLIACTLQFVGAMI